MLPWGLEGGCAVPGWDEGVGFTYRARHAHLRLWAVLGNQVSATAGPPSHLRTIPGGAPSVGAGPDPLAFPGWDRGNSLSAASTKFNSICESNAR